MMYQLDLVQVGELLAGQARAANREIVKHYGSDHPDFKQRMRFLSQCSFVRDLGIGCEAETDGNAGKELYTKIVIFDGSGHSQEFSI